MPVAKACAGLPRLGNNLAWSTSFHVPCYSFPLLLVKNLAEHYCAHFPLAHIAIVIVEMSSNLQSCVTNRIERHHSCVKIQQIGVVAVYGIKSAVVEVCHKAL